MEVNCKAPEKFKKNSKMTAKLKEKGNQINPSQQACVSFDNAILNNL
jgi:hypothetical protein